jgi:putative transposase
MAGIAAQVGYKRRPGRSGGKPALIASNSPDRQFEVDAPDKVWVTDITDIKIHKGWLYLAVVIDPFSRRMVGPLSRFAGKPLPGNGSAQPRMTTELALQALLAAVWRRKPKAKVMIHSDSQKIVASSLAVCLKH